MSGEGVNGLSSVREEQSRQSARLSQVEGKVERIDERTIAQGREQERQGRVLERIEGKVEKAAAAISNRNAVEQGGRQVGESWRTRAGVVGLVLTLAFGAVGAVYAFVQLIGAA